MTSKYENKLDINDCLGSWPSGFDTQGFNFTVGESSAQQNAEPENNFLELNKEVKM